MERFNRMSEQLKIKMYSFTLDCKDTAKLAKFYADLLQWEMLLIDEDFACVYPPGTQQGAYPGITFQHNPDYIKPVWPDEPNAQQQMAHMDFAVNDLGKSIQHAIKCGATPASGQFSDIWRVMIDPAGHPFCLCEMKAVMESEHFGLL